MNSLQTTPCRKSSAARTAKLSGWHRQVIRSQKDKTHSMQTVERQLAANGYSAEDTFAVTISLDEALANAVKHGHDNSYTKPIYLRYRVQRDRVVIQVEDRGPGFDPKQVPDPRAPENLEKECGRGLFIMRFYMTWVTHFGRGNCVTMCKQRSH